MANERIYHELQADTVNSAINVPEVDATVFARTETGLRLVKRELYARGGHTLTDQLFVVGSTPLLISERAYDQIRRLQVCPSIEWHPVQITWRRSTYPYWAGETIIEHDIWDYDRSDYALIDDDGPRQNSNVAFMRNGVIKARLVPEFDLFHAEFNQWIGSESMKVLWEAAALTGMRFAAVEISE